LLKGEITFVAAPSLVMENLQPLANISNISLKKLGDGTILLRISSPFKEGFKRYFAHYFHIRFIFVTHTVDNTITNLKYYVRFAFFQLIGIYLVVIVFVANLLFDLWDKSLLMTLSQICLVVLMIIFDLRNLYDSRTLAKDLVNDLSIRIQTDMRSKQNG
jgi:hypothetical protein